MDSAFFLLIRTAIGVVFFAVVLSYYVLLFWKTAPKKREKNYHTVTIIIPAHNEEKYIEASVRSALNAEFPGQKEIIVVDDGSTDKTAEIVSGIPGVECISTPHTGKAPSLNMAIARAQGELIVIIDGDTEIRSDALLAMKEEVEKVNVAAATCPIVVKNRQTLILAWLHIETIYSSLLRLVMAKVNANITTQGQFGIFRKDALMAIGGFSIEGFAEDVDVTIRLIRAGYHVGFAEGTVGYTYMPEGFKYLLFQRIRWVRGMINILSRHVGMNSALIDVYTLPLMIFSYVQAVIMGSFTIYQLFGGYWHYFASKGQFLNAQVLVFLLDWTSITGVIKWSLGVFTGSTPLTLINIVGILSTLLCYPLYFYAILKFDRKFDFWHLLSLTFMAPYWWCVMCVQIGCLPFLLWKRQENIWHKNDQSWVLSPRRSGLPIEPLSTTCRPEKLLSLK